MSSDYDFSDDEDNYYSDEDMIDGTQNEESSQSEAEMDMDEFGDDFKVSERGKRKSYEIEFQSLTHADVEKLMRSDVEHICGIFGVDADTANLLLRHFSWNKERLIEKYMDNSTPVLVSAGVSRADPPPPSVSTRTSSNNSTSQSSRRSTRSASKIFSNLNPTKPSSQPSPPSSSKSSLMKSLSTAISVSPTTSFVCQICFDDLPVKQLSLHCSHAFCSNCWIAFLSSKIRDDSEHATRCMAEGCSLIIPDSFVRSALKTATSETELKRNQGTLARFEDLIVRHFVACNQNLKYCPYPECTNTVSCPAAASKQSLTTMVPTVACGARGIGAQPIHSPSQPLASFGLAGKEHKFCFGCAIEGDHRPIVCAAANMWLRKCRDDSETANWIKSNTKECGQCQSTIEKNGGCNHMTCKKCKHEFCWVCMGPWSEHGTAWYSCNRYDEKAGVEARDAQSKSRASLERYLHYYNRWANHEQSAKLSVELYTKTEKKMEDMQITSALTWIEVQFMKKAVEEVEKCRTTLKWTYAMAYFLAKGNQKDLFEDNQRDLEKAVEDLSELLESPLEPENIPLMRQKVTDKTVYVQKRNEIMLEDTAAGFLEDRWKWNVTVNGFDEPDRDVV